MENEPIITKNNATCFPQNVQISAFPKQRSFTKQERTCVWGCVRAHSPSTGYLFFPL